VILKACSLKEEKIDELDFLKIKNFYSMKGTVMRRYRTEKIPAKSHI